MLIRTERGRAINIAISDTYKVLRMKGKNPKSPLNGFQLEEESRVQRFFSLMTGNALKKRENPIISRKRIAKTAIPTIKYLANLSLIFLTFRI
jgi:hypothetical protein